MAFRPEEFRDLEASGDPRVLGWFREAIQDGERYIRADPQYSKMDKLQDFNAGEQWEGDAPSYVPRVVLNHIKKAIKAHSSVLTDVRPLFAFKTYNEQFKTTSELLNNLTVFWWVNNFIDMSVANVIRYSLVCGTGDVCVEYDPDFGYYGDTKLTVKDPRDLLPIRPSRDLSIQSWEGMIIKEASSYNVLAAKYPEKAHLLKPAKSGVLSQVFTKFKKTIRDTVTTPVSTLDGLRSRSGVGAGADELNVYRALVKDRSLNQTGARVLMGDPQANWSYWVEPGKPLYPRKRLIISTDNAVLYDGPASYWHGMFNVCRLKLDPWPWHFFGLPLVGDLCEVQKAINQTASDFLSVFSQWVNRGLIADSQAVPESVVKRFDPREPHWKLRAKTGMAQNGGIQLQPGPDTPTWSMMFFERLLEEFDNLAGTANLQALLQLRQSPAAETIQKYLDAMTPEMRDESRQIEFFLREMAEMVKVNFFQFYSAERRMLMLGDAGATLQDFDFDPGSMVPAMRPSEDGYVAELDSEIPRDSRAQYFHKLFTFWVSPQSILAMNAMERKLTYVQLARMGYMDFWSTMEMLEIPNVGAPPPIPLPVPGKEGELQTDPMTGQPIVDMMTGQPVPLTELRVPQTITERLQAQSMLGIGMTESPVGRKATGQEAPQIKQKPDQNGAPRVTISESG